MTPKERMMTALRKEAPDRLPVTLHQWQDYHLNTYMGGMSAAEAFADCGLDASVQYCEPIGQFWVSRPPGAYVHSPDWREVVSVLPGGDGHHRERHVVATPKGTLSYTTESDGKTVWLTEHPVKRPEDALLYRYMPVFGFDKKAIAKAYDELGDGGILRGLVWGDQVGCWQQACSLYGTTEMIYATYDDPDWVHTFLGILLDKKLEFIAAALDGARFDIVETGGGAASSTVISPQMFRDFCLPYDQKIHDELHRLGHMVTYHTCGGMKGIFDEIIATGTDVSETLSPLSIGGNIEGPDAYRALHGKVGLIGGMDQINLLTMGTPEAIEKEVFRLFETFGKGGGYVLSACDHFWDAPRENLVAFARAARECVY